jgi:hypothetical protein
MTGKPSSRPKRNEPQKDTAMKTTRIHNLMVAALVGVLALLASHKALAAIASPEINPGEARAVTEEAYVFGFAIVEHNKAVWAYGVEPKSPVYGGFNAVHNETQHKEPEDAAVVSANNDTF